MQFRSIYALQVEFFIISQTMVFRLWIVQIFVTGCCDYIAQCMMVRCTHLNNPPSDPDTLQRVPVGISSMQPQESPEETRRSEDICINNPPTNSNTYTST